jgi:microcompartment protein CcmL/EutN
MVGSSGAAASVALRNAGDTATFVTLTAKYKGARANNWTVTVQANPVDNTKKDLILLESGVEVERHSGLSASVPAEWVSGISSNLFVVTAGAASDVNNTSGAAFGAGDSGFSLTQSDWTAFQSGAESQTFNVLGPASLTDATVRGALVTWTIARNTSGQRFILVIGGAAGEVLSAAVTRSTSAANENVVNFGYTDLLDADGNTISTAAFVPRLAGIIADAGVTRSITQQRVTDVTLKVVPTNDDIATAYAAGVVMFVSDSVSPRIHQDMTTYVDNTPTKPRSEFGKIKSVRTHHQIESDLTFAANNGWLGGDSVNVPVVQTVILSGISNYLRNLEEAGVVQAGWTVVLDPEEDSTGDALYLKYGISTVKSIERIFNTIVLA